MQKNKIEFRIDKQNQIAYHIYMNTDEVIIDDIFIINKKAKHTLSECLSFYSKDILKLLAATKNASENSDILTLKKTEIIAELENYIPEKFLYAFRFWDINVFKVFHLLYSDDDKFNEAIRKNLKETVGEEFIEEMQQDAMKLLFTSGFIFAFKTPSSKEVEIVIPDEIYDLIPKLYDSININGKKMIPGNLDMFPEYAKTLASLYGVCTPEVFMEIFNRDFPETKIKDTEECIILMKQCVSSIMPCRFFQGKLIDMSITEDFMIEAVEFRRNSLKPHIPSKKELALHQDLDDYDEENRYIEAFAELLCNLFNDDEYGYTFLFDNLKLIKIGTSPEAFLAPLIDNLGNHIDSKTQKALFDAYEKIRKNCHMWDKWGNTDTNAEKNRLDEKPEKKILYSDRWLEDLKKQREEKSRVKLTEDCQIPSDAEIASLMKTFDDYWGGGDREPVWYKNEYSNSSIRKMYKKLYKKYSLEMESFGTKLNALLLDQLISSVYHENHGDGEFGRQKWRYSAFEPVKKIRKNVFLCLRTDGTPFFLYSPMIDKLFDEGISACISIVIDMNGWYCTYGPILTWLAFRPTDFEILAERLMPGTYREKGLSAVIQSNPFPFWLAYKDREILPAYEDETHLLACEARGRFKNGKIPAVLNEWEHQEFGKYERWEILDVSQFKGVTLYHDKNSDTILLVSFSEESFDRAFKTLADFFDEKTLKVEKFSKQMSDILDRYPVKGIATCKVEAFFDRMTQ